jgi:hypothetical protein
LEKKERVQTMMQMSFLSSRSSNPNEINCKFFSLFDSHISFFFATQPHQPKQQIGELGTKRWKLRVTNIKKSRAVFQDPMKFGAGVGGQEMLLPY